VGRGDGCGVLRKVGTGVGLRVGVRVGRPIQMVENDTSEQNLDPNK
jgi:hypothetical protein